MILSSIVPVYPIESHCQLQGILNSTRAHYPGGKFMLFLMNLENMYNNQPSQGSLPASFSTFVIKSPTLYQVFNCYSMPDRGRVRARHMIMMKLTTTAPPEAETLLGDLILPVGAFSRRSSRSHANC